MQNSPSMCKDVWRKEGDKGMNAVSLPLRAHAITPWLLKEDQSHHMCVQKVHTYNKRIEISETMLYITENIFIITLTTIRVRGNSS